MNCKPIKSAVLQTGQKIYYTQYRIADIVNDVTFPAPFQVANISNGKHVIIIAKAFIRDPKDKDYNTVTDKHNKYIDKIKSYELKDEDYIIYKKININPKKVNSCSYKKKWSPIVIMSKAEFENLSEEKYLEIDSEVMKGSKNA